MNQTLLRLLTCLLLLSNSHFTFADPSLRIRLATTTSTYHSGLLDYLLDEFKKDSGYTVDVLATGTGKALKLGENGDVDLVMTHDPKAEAQFIEKGYGILPRKVMYNDFVLVGPKNDPVKVSEQDNIQQAFSTIAEHNHLFISRGDESGTHKKELVIWQENQITPIFSHYRSVGQGMGPTLTMASEMQAYTLTDRGTWLAYQNRLDLVILYQVDPLLFNPYQVILVNPERYPNTHYQGAKILSDWLVNPKGQQLINQFRVHGQALFVANANE